MKEHIDDKRIRLWQQNAPRLRHGMCVRVIEGNFPGEGSTKPNEDKSHQLYFHLECDISMCILEAGG
jgi:hypothetical protein